MKRSLIVFFTTLLLLSGCGERPEPPVRESPATEASASGEPEPTEPATEISAKEDEVLEPATEIETVPPLSSEPGESASSTAPIEILTITVPEGYTLARIGMTMEEKGLCTAEEFIEAAQTGDFSSYPLVAAQRENPNRCFSLEGYLFPATYEVYSIETADAIIRRMLDHAEKKFTAELRAEIESSGYTVDEILTLASIIEKEAFGHEHMPNISSVLHNRLDSGMKLQCDVTITYVEGAIKPFITGDINRFNEYYNTYKCAALPAGAICNPGMDAILAALRPRDTDFLFFLTDAEKEYYFAETWEEHEGNVRAAGLDQQVGATAV